MYPDTGRALWHLLHAYAHAQPEGPLSPQAQDHARTWLAAFDRAVEAASQGTCPCHQHWSRILASYPPDLTSRRSFYWWTVRVHDQVNARLARPRLFPDLA